MLTRKRCKRLGQVREQVHGCPLKGMKGQMTSRIEATVIAMVRWVQSCKLSRSVPLHLIECSWSSHCSLLPRLSRCKRLHPPNETYRLQAALGRVSPPETGSRLRSKRKS